MAGVRAAGFVSALTEAGYQPTRVAPSAASGVGITRWVGDRNVLVEFFHDGYASALFADDGTQQLQNHSAKATPQGFQNASGSTDHRLRRRLQSSQPLDDFRAHQRHVQSPIGNVALQPRRDLA